MTENAMAGKDKDSADKNHEKGPQEKPLKASRPLNPRKRGLGRGLNALFGDEEETVTGSGTEVGGEEHDRAGRQTLGIDQLTPSPFQPRQAMADEALDELAESVSAHGILQPLLVRQKPDQDDQYEIIAGERRWRAAQKAGLHDVPVIIRALDNTQAMEIALIENLQRENLNAIEEAEGYKRLLDEFGHTQAQLAESLGKSRSHIANMVRLLTLPAPVREFLREDKLSAGHARALITSDNAVALAEKVVEDGLSVRETERLAAGRPKRKAKKGSAPPKKDVDTLALEDRLTNQLGMRVTIDMKNQEEGRLSVSFTSLDQLDELLDLIS